MKPIAFAILIASAITVATVSCDRNDEDEHEKAQLQTPEPTVSDLTGSGFTVSWEAVANAGSYEYRLNGSEPVSVDATSETFSGLASGDYRIEIRAIAADREKYTDSEWGSVSATLEEPESDIRVEAYYTGDFYGTGLGNGWINFTLEDGTVVCVDLNFTKADNPDFQTIPEGTYTADQDGTHSGFTFNTEGDSYVFRNDSNSPITDGTMEVAATAEGYSVKCSFVYGEGNIDFTYSGVIRLINHSDEGQWSNLEGDIAVDGLVQGAQILLGDIFESGESIQYAIILAQEDYDLQTNYGQGKAIVLYVNAPNDATGGVPDGTFGEFIDLNTATEAPAGTAIAGTYFYGTYYGCWYFDAGNQNEASLKAGSFTVEQDGSSGTYNVSGTLEDGYGNKVQFSYNGTLPRME